MVKICNKNIKLNSFTHYNVVSLLFCIYYNNLFNFYSIITCWSWSIFLTFHSAILYDKNAYVKIRKKININFIEFHIGNFILHVVPCVYLYIYPPNHVSFQNSFISLILKYLWVCISTNMTMDLSDIYVDFSKKNVKKLYLTSILGNILVPVYYKIIIK
jgi:hypothetical protein